MHRKYWCSNYWDGNCINFTIILNSEKKENSITIKDSEECYDTIDVIIHVDALYKVRELLEKENLLDDFLDAVFKGIDKKELYGED